MCVCRRGRCSAFGIFALQHANVTRLLMVAQQSRGTQITQIVSNIDGVRAQVASKQSHTGLRQDVSLGMRLLAVAMHMMQAILDGATDGVAIWQVRVMCGS